MDVQKLWLGGPEIVKASRSLETDSPGGQTSFPSEVGFSRFLDVSARARGCTFEYEIVGEKHWPTPVHQRVLESVESGPLGFLLGSLGCFSQLICGQ